MKLARIVLALTLIGAISGCAAIKRGAATARFCEERAKDHVYAQSLEGLKSHVMADLAMHRPLAIPAMNKKPGISTTSSFKYEREESIDDDDHFIMKGVDAVYEGIRVDSTASRMRITAPTNGDRMFNREWLFLKRADPDKASKILAEADRQLDENGNARQ